MYFQNSFRYSHSSYISHTSFQSRNYSKLSPQHSYFATQDCLNSYWMRVFWLKSGMKEGFNTFFQLILVIVLQEIGRCSDRSSTLLYKTSYVFNCAGWWVGRVTWRELHKRFHEIIVRLANLVHLLLHLLAQHSVRILFSQLRWKIC